MVKPRLLTPRPHYATPFSASVLELVPRQRGLAMGRKKISFEKPWPCLTAGLVSFFFFSVVHLFSAAISNSARRR